MSIFKQTASSILITLKMEQSFTGSILLSQKVEQKTVSFLFSTPSRILPLSQLRKWNTCWLTLYFGVDMKD